MKYLLAIIGTIFLLMGNLSCKHPIGDKPHSVYLNSFITYYNNLNNIKLECSIDGRAILILPYYKLPIYTYDSKYEHILRPYDSLCLLHNDVGYNKIASGIPMPTNVAQTITPDFTTIRIWSDKDFNSTHPAKSLLSDIVRFMSFSYEPFISSRYYNECNIDQMNLSAEFKKYLNVDKNRLKLVYGSYVQFEGRSGLMPLFPIDKKVCDLSHKDLTLLYGTIKGESFTLEDKNRATLYSKISLGILYFTSPPDSPGDYDITVEMIGDNGKTYSATTTMRFE